MRTISNDENQGVTPVKKEKNMPKLETFSTTISDGREIMIREMTGRDLIYMEKDLTKAGDVEKGMRIIERLIVGDDKITYDEILDLGVKDFRKLSELVAKANGTDEEDPN
jgi:uncharacterized protein YtpQ (UPF0354 family)